MRVTGSTGARLSPPDGGGGRTTIGSGFSLARPAPPAMPAAPSAPLAASALLELQDIALPLAERRRGAIKKGLSLLDRLDELRLGLLEGAVSPATLQGLRAEIGRAAERHDDDLLSGLLDAIDVRCAVEVAKLEAADAIG